MIRSLTVPILPQMLLSLVGIKNQCIPSRNPAKEQVRRQFLKNSKVNLFICSVPVNSSTSINSFADGRPPATDSWSISNRSQKKSCLVINGTELLLVVLNSILSFISIIIFLVTVCKFDFTQIGVIGIKHRQWSLQDSHFVITRKMVSLQDLYISSRFHEEDVVRGVYWHGYPIYDRLAPIQYKT